MNSHLRAHGVCEQRIGGEVLVDTDLDEAAKDEIVAAAKQICTVGNTLQGQPSFAVVRVPR